MPKDNDNQTSLGGAPKDGAFAASASVPVEEKPKTTLEQLGNVTKKVADKIKACENILVALSKDPDVDEISAAIGLTMILNKLGKHVTAIYSGETPNTLEFLKPEDTFEKDTNSLQDFIIALNKDKADHLRYKIEGDYVKVYITPYKTTITDKDLEFSQGDFNVDLVISIDVESGEAIDDALSEYGRIMHDATAINITTNAAGRFAELEWSDPSMSSCCEMIALLADELGYKEFEQPVATALLTGIVAATDRFSNARTTSETMALSSKLMQAGADQQLISTNIMKPAEAPKVEVAPVEPDNDSKEEVPSDTLVVQAETPEAETSAEEAPAEPLIPEPTLAVPTTPEVPVAMQVPEAPVPVEATAPIPAMPEVPAVPAVEVPEMPVAPVVEAPTVPETPAPVAPVVPETPENSTFVLPGQPSADDVQAAMNEILNPVSTADAIAAADATAPIPTMPEASVTPVTPEVSATPAASVVPEAPAAPTAPVVPAAPAVPEAPTAPQIISQGVVIEQNVAEPIQEEPDYGSMIDQALTEAMNPVANPAMSAAPTVPEQAPEAATIPNLQYIDPNATPAAMMNPQPIAEQSEINLPPAPTPNVDTTAFQIPK